MVAVCVCGGGGSGGSLEFDLDPGGKESTAAAATLLIDPSLGGPCCRTAQVQGPPPQLPERHPAGRHAAVHGTRAVQRQQVGCLTHGRGRHSSQHLASPRTPAPPRPPALLRAHSPPPQSVPNSCHAAAGLQGGREGGCLQPGLPAVRGGGAAPPLCPPAERPRQIIQRAVPGAPPPPSLSRCATLHIASEPVRALLCPPSAPDAPIIGAGPRVLAHISTHPHSYLCTHAAKLSFAPNAGLI